MTVDRKLDFYDAWLRTGVRPRGAAAPARSSADRKPARSSTARKPRKP